MLHGRKLMRIHATTNSPAHVHNLYTAFHPFGYEIVTVTSILCGFYKIEDHTFTAVMAIRTISPYRSSLTLIIELTLEPSEAPSRLPITV
ncbi:hypothetical protein SAMN05518856_101570 [Paenibacillus sp. OK003]|nr:hypothetical protein SAMN05518856_101570 [Paenibacillus sp. OK003]